jgi:predicted alpha/beta hydrolase family esterase
VTPALPPLLIVPGYRGSGPDHWQTWLQHHVAGATRVDGIDWEAPVLAVWAGQVRDALARASRPVRIFAHSFGCLAAVVAAADRPEQVAELILAAPADPARFDFTGLKPEGVRTAAWCLASALPTRPLNVSGCILASRNDPWLSYDKAVDLAARWRLVLHDVGAAGHINPDAGYGPWPLALQLASRPIRHTSGANTTLKKGRGSVLAAVRQLTRQQLESPSRQLRRTRP